MRSFRFTRPFAPILVFASSMIALSTQSLVHAQKPIEQTPPPIAQEAIKKQTEADPGKPVQSTGSLLFKPGVSPQDRVRSERTEARDYRHGGVTTTKSPVKTLPLFGYDLFKSAREAVDNSRKFHQLQAQKDFKAEQQDGDLTSQSQARKNSASKNGETDATDNSKTANRTTRSDTNEIPQQNAFSTPIGPSGFLARNISADIPANYQLSAGDTITIRISSPTLQAITLTKTIDSQGRVEIDEIGYLTVRGQSIESAERSLQVQLRPYYKNVQVSISAPKLHTIQVLVTGAAYDPGSYSIPAVTTAFNLLTAAGGPMEDGSLRDVEVRRRGKVVSKLDLYRLILGDAQINDIQLQSGDMLVVPPRKSRVSINGEVLKPAIYELVSGETLKEALNFAGGVRRSGLSQSVRINTVTPGSERIIKDVSLNDATPLYDGDEVEVFSVRNRLTNRVTIEGAVDLPNDYAMKPGMRISDLIDRAHGPLSEAFLQQAELHRWQPDNTDMLITFDLEKAMAHDPKSDLELQKWDRIRVYNREEVAYIGLRRVEIAGAVKMPGIYDASRKMRVSDLLRMAGGPLPDAELESAHLLHFHAGAPYTHEYVSLQNSSLSKPESDPEILDNDRLIVFHVDEAKFTPPFRVEIRGEVVTPGIYPRTSGMRLSDLLAYAGGLKPSSGNSIEIAHARRLEDGNNTRVVSVSLEPNRLPSSQNDQLLEDGDVVSIKGIGGFQPEVRSFIVIGAVNKPGTVFISRNGMRLSDAIREAGGLRTDAYATGAEFYRDPKSLVTTGQHIMVEQLEMLNQLLNDSVIKQEIAKSQLDLIRAAGAAAVDATGGISGTSATQNPGAVSAIGKIDPAQLVAPARKFNGAQLDPNGYVAINLPLALQKPQGKDDIILLDGDIISVPKTPTTVQVLGAVYSKRGVLFEKGRRLEYYIDQAGGYTVDAAREKIEIFRVNGAVVSGRKSKDLEPGDVIVVPTKALSARLSSRGNTLGDLFKAITSSAILYRLSTGIFGL